MVANAPYIINKVLWSFLLFHIDITEKNGGKKLILKKKRINKLSCLDFVNQGKKIVVALRDAMRFKDTLVKLGFSDELKEGERILPLPMNPSTTRNAEKFYVIDKTKPKETYSQTLWWTRHEWAGRGETREVTDYVSIPRKRYPRTEYAPYSVELILKYDDYGQLMVVTDPLLFSKSDEKLILNTINIFLISFQECEVLTDNLEKLLPVQVVRLNWEVLPKGEYPWSKMRENLERMSVRKGKTARQMMMDKCEYINSFHPDFRAYGKSGFSGYVIFGFQDRNLYVLESVYPNNATYVFGTDWEELSKLSKAEILNDNLQNARLIHHDNWQKEITELLGA